MSPDAAPLGIDLFCGLGGWAQGMLAARYGTVVGFDIERHDYGEHRYPAQLVIQDVRTLHGSQFKDAALIVASPPCQEFSYMSFPFGRPRQIARALRGEDEFPEGYTGSRTVEELTALFDACFRIQREVCAAAGRHIPLVVENVRGAQTWVGRAAWHYGSYYLWGDIPAIMPVACKRGVKVDGFRFDGSGKSFQSASVDGVKGGLDWSKHAELDYRTSGAAGCFRDSATKNSGGSWFNIGSPGQKDTGRNPVHELVKEKTVGHINQRDGHAHTRHLTNQAESDSVKCGGDWFGNGNYSPMRHGSSKSTARKMAAAMIAKIPARLAFHIAEVYRAVAHRSNVPHGSND